MTTSVSMTCGSSPGPGWMKSKGKPSTRDQFLGMSVYPDRPWKGWLVATAALAARLVIVLHRPLRMVNRDWLHDCRMACRTAVGWSVMGFQYPVNRRLPTRVLWGG